MIYRLILVLVILLSYAFFGNIFLKGRGKLFFSTLEKTLLGIGISVLVYLILGFVLEGPLVVSRNILAVAEGILIGWIVALFRHIAESN